jgi:hypothetical protein
MTESRIEPGLSGIKGVALRGLNVSFSVKFPRTAVRHSCNLPWQFHGWNRLNRNKRLAQWRWPRIASDNILRRENVLPRFDPGPSRGSFTRQRWADLKGRSPSWYDTKVWLQWNWPTIHTNSCWLLFLLIIPVWKANSGRRSLGDQSCRHLRHRRMYATLCWLESSWISLYIITPKNKKMRTNFELKEFLWFDFWFTNLTLVVDWFFRFNENRHGTLWKVENSFIKERLESGQVQRQVWWPQISPNKKSTLFIVCLC